MRAPQLLALGLGLALLVNCGSSEHASVHARPPENLHEVSKGVYSGASPEGDEGFEALAQLGVKTVISVDGAKPEVDIARKHGLRYVHLPIGYDGVPQERGAELAKALEELPGPVYIHCHHGQHRGPAAAVVACVVAGKINNEQAVRVMKEMGTGEQYQGLWAAAKAAKPADPGALRSLSVQYREVAPIPPLAEAMVDIDVAFDNLQLCRKNNWLTPKDHPDVTAAHEALKIREVAFELARTDDCRGRPEDFRRMLEAMRKASSDLQDLLQRTTDPGDQDRAAWDRTLGLLRQSCADCHKTYRNSRKK